MRNFSVSFRIIGGYIIVVALATITSITGYLGISSMSDSFEKVIDNAMPMIDRSDQMANKIFLAQRKLNQVSRADDLEVLSKLESEYNELIAQYHQIAKSLSNSLNGEGKLLKTFKNANSIASEFSASANELIKNQRDQLAKASIVSAQHRQFGDMGDETLSFAYDIEGSAELDSTFESLTTLQTAIENSAETVNDAIRAGIKPAVLQAESDLRSLFADITSLSAQLEKVDSLIGNEGFKGLNQAFAKQKQASENLLNAYKQQLDAERLVSVSMTQVEASTDAIITELEQLTNSVKAYTESIKLEANTVTENRRLSLIIFSVIAIVVSIFVAVLITRSIRIPLELIVNKIGILAKGDLTETFSSSSKDELGKLENSMQAFVSELHNILSEISASSEQLAATSEESSSISKQTFENVSRQRQQTDQMVTSVNEMTATVAEVSNSANHTLSEVESAHADMNRAEQVLKQNIERFQLLSEEIKAGAGVIQDLNDDSKNIGGVLDVIKAIAEQTNLLALNAAIEAARAGEQGRGFAVVADEVRSLASRSQDSTAEIEDMIARLQSRAQKAVSVMEKSETEAQTSVERIEEAGLTLQKVAQAISTIKDMSHQIASAAEEQSVASQSQLENITLIADAADENSTGAQESLSASEELASMAEKQRAIVTKFKL